MHRSNRLATIAGGVLAAGGIAWLAKLAVIAATSGRVTDSGAAAVFYFAGLVLLVAGAVLCGIVFTYGRRAAVRVGAGVLAPLAFIGFGVVVLEGVGRAVLATEGTWWYDEVGIFLNAVVGAGVGVAMLLRYHQSTRAPAT